MSTLFQTLFQAKRWANREIFEVAAANLSLLDPDDQRFVVRILNHAYVVDQIFRGNLLRQPHGFTAANTPETPDIADLSQGVDALDGWFLDYVSGLQPDELTQPIPFSFVDGTPGLMTREQMLMHLITHGSYHRGAAGRPLQQRGVTLPRDTLTVFLHRA
jgi:uncharacterized damage-inducible protein DinB